MRIIYFTSILLFGFSLCSTAQQKTSGLAPKIPMEVADQFRISLASPQTRIYGGGDPIPHHFFNELLPAYFTRTLYLPDSVQNGVTLRWIFTGPHGGITVKVTNSQVMLIQRYYDSYALGSEEDKKARYPSKVLKQTSVSLSNSPHAIAITIQQLKAIITVDGNEALKQESLLDLTHHQLAIDAPAVADETIRVSLQKPAIEKASVTINSASKHQSILGFGGIMSFPAFHAMTASDQEQWFKMLSQNNLLIEREYPAGVHLKKDLSNYAVLADAVPHYYGDNFPTGEISDFGYNKQIFAMGGQVLFEFWGLPEWMQGATKNTVNVGEYVRAIVGYCRQSMAKAGRPPNIVGIQNELLQDKDTWRDMVLELRKGLDAAGFKEVKIHMPDASTLDQGIHSVKTLQEYPAVWKTLDFSASHVYDYQKTFDNPDGYDSTIKKWNTAIENKPFLLTELTINDQKYQTMSDYQTAFAMAQLYQKALTKMDAKLLAYCWLLLDPEQPTFGATRSLFVLDRSDSFHPKPSGDILRTFLAFSRRLPQGIVRVEASSDDPEIRVSAFSAAGLGQTMILLNTSTVPKKLSWTGITSAFSDLEIVDPYHANSVERAPRSGQLVIEPGAIVTLTNISLRSDRKE